MVFSIESVKHLPAAEPRWTKDIGSEAPCDACAIRHAAVHVGINDTDFSQLISIATKVYLRRKQTLFTEGDPADLLYSILHGAMMVYKMTSDGRRQITGFLYDGDILGLTSEGKYAYNAEAIAQSTLYRYPMKAAEKVIQRYPEMEHRLREITRQELVEAQEQMLLLGRKTAKERVASFLLKLKRQSMDRGRHDAEVSVPMTREMIGDYLGVTTETVSRILTDFRQQGLISATAGQAIELFNAKALEAIACGPA